MSKLSGGTKEPTPIGTIAADPAAPPWMRRVPMVTGALAALAGFLTVRGAELSHQAIYHDATAGLYQNKASDTWGQYEAESIKKDNVETALMISQLDPDQRAKLEARKKQFADRQPALQATAKEYEADVETEKSGGDKLLSEKAMTDFAGVAAQLGIALASVAALTKKSAWFGVGVVCGLLALLITGWSFLVHFQIGATISHLLHLKLTVLELSPT
jgi:hypothetical protein